MDIYEELVRLRRLGQKCALATIVQVRGSIPSYESAKLLVREDGSMAGTIGGGCVEAEVWTAAREVIETERPKHLTFNLGQDAAYDNGLICGGQLDVFVEPIIPQPRAFIFGAGHISKSLSKVATLAGFEEPLFLPLEDQLIAPEAGAQVLVLGVNYHGRFAQWGDNPLKLTSAPIIVPGVIITLE